MPPISKSLESIAHDAQTNEMVGVKNNKEWMKNEREMGMEVECMRSDAVHCEIQYR